MSVEQNFLQNFYSQILNGCTKTTKTHAHMTKNQNCPSGGPLRIGTHQGGSACPKDKQKEVTAKEDKHLMILVLLHVIWISLKNIAKEISRAPIQQMNQGKSNRDKNTKS